MRRAPWNPRATAIAQRDASLDVAQHAAHANAASLILKR
jgi:hypothetical protein